MTTITPDFVLQHLRKLSANDRLIVISQALPDIEAGLVDKPLSFNNLGGLLRDLQPAPAEFENADSRKEMMKGLFQLQPGVSNL